MAIARRGRFYRMALLAGLGLGVGLAAWRLSRGAAAADALVWGLGGPAIALVLAAVADLGIRLQRRDLPPPP